MEVIAKRPFHSSNSNLSVREKGVYLPKQATSKIILAQRLGRLLQSPSRTPPCRQISPHADARPSVRPLPIMKRLKFTRHVKNQTAVARMASTFRDRLSLLLDNAFS